jgi:hypothetical protein
LLAFGGLEGLAAQVYPLYCQNQRFLRFGQGGLRVHVLSQRANLRAGTLIEYVEYNYPYNFPPYKTFLLVQKQFTIHSGCARMSKDRRGSLTQLDQLVCQLRTNDYEPTSLLIALFQ